MSRRVFRRRAALGQSPRRRRPERSGGIRHPLHPQGGSHAVVAASRIPPRSRRPCGVQRPAARAAGRVRCAGPVLPRRGGAGRGRAVHRGHAGRPGRGRRDAHVRRAGTPPLCGRHGRLCGPAEPRAAARGAPGARRGLRGAGLVRQRHGAGHPPHRGPRPVGAGPHRPARAAPGRRLCLGEQGRGRARVRAGHGAGVHAPGVQGRKRRIARRARVGLRGRQRRRLPRARHARGRHGGRPVGGAWRRGHPAQRTRDQLLGLLPGVGPGQGAEWSQGQPHPSGRGATSPWAGRTPRR